MMSYSQYRQRNGSGNGKLPAISSAISGKKSPVASEDEEHLTQEGSFTGSSSRINPYNRQPFSSAKRKSKMGRLKTAPLPTRCANFAFDEEEENQEISEETTTEKENSHQPIAVAKSTVSNDQSATRQTLSTGTCKMRAVSLSEAARHDRLNFPRSPEKKFPAPIRNSPTKPMSSLARRHIERKQSSGQPFQHESKNHSVPLNLQIDISASTDHQSRSTKCPMDVKCEHTRNTSKSKDSTDSSMAVTHTNKSGASEIPSSITIKEEEKPGPNIEQPMISQVPKISVNGLNLSTFETQNKDIVQIDGSIYRKIGKIGSGGSSVVYKALDENNQIRAIKRVNLSEIDQKQAEDFKNEIHYLEKLKGNERIIEIFGWEQKKDEDGEALYVVMEYGEKDLGKLLNELCGKSVKNVGSSESARKAVQRRELTDNKIKFYWEEMLEAVQIIHQVGIVHRDLKPANFVIVGGKLKLIDFGIASSVADDKTHVTMDNAMGTFNFMSPEAVKSVSSASGAAVVKLNYKADVWSLGCILYNMIYNKMPFGHIKQPWAKIHAIADPNHEIAIHDNELKGHDPLVNKVLKLCLVREPSNRASIEDLLVHPYLKSKGSTNTPIRGKAIDDLLETCTDLTPNSFKKAILKGMRGLDAQK